MTKLCYCCNTPLIRKEQATLEQISKERYQSLEHIIPDGIGGKLTSWELLCKACNSTLGHELDSHLCNSIPLRGVLPYKMDKSNKPRSTLGRTKDGLEVRINTMGKVSLPRPQVFLTDDRKKIHRVHHYSSDVNAVKGFLRKVLSENPQIEQNLDEILETYLLRKGETNGELFFDQFAVGGRKFHRAVTKIAVGYALFSGIPTGVLANSIQYVIGHSFQYIPIKPHHPLSFARPYKMPKDSKEISHVLFLKGDPNRKLLYCYVEIFNTLCFIVILNDDYRGEKIEHPYGFEVLKRERLINPEVKLNLFRNPLHCGLNNDPKYHYDQIGIKEKFTRIIEVINSFSDIL